MTDTSPDPVATYLAAVRERASSGKYYNPALLRNEDVPHLLDALEAALELAGEWRKTAADLGERAQKVADGGDHTQSALLRYQAQAHEDDADRLERVITARLLGERPRLRETEPGK